MIGLDVADLVVIASEVLGCDTGTALAQADITAAGRPGAGWPGRQGQVAGRGADPGAGRGARHGAGRGVPAPRRRLGGRGRPDGCPAAASPVPRSPRADGGRGRTAVPGRQRLAGQPRRTQGCGHRHRTPCFGPAHPGAGRILAGGPAVSGLQLACRAGTPASHAATEIPGGADRARRQAALPPRDAPQPPHHPHRSGRHARGRHHAGHRAHGLHRSRQASPHPRQAGILAAGPASRPRAHPAGPGQRGRRPRASRPWSGSGSGRRRYASRSGRSPARNRITRPGIRRKPRRP